MPALLHLHPATVRSWEQEFSGRADSLLRQALEIWMKNPIGVPYARSLAIVQSSGTGKSRVNDELAKQIVYVPMLLSVRSNGECRSERRLFALV